MAFKNTLDFFLKKPKLYAIELDDVKINKAVFSLILKTEKHLKELTEVIRTEDITSKDAKLSELENNLLIIKSKIDSLKTDVQRILAIEIQNKDYITLHDEGYLDDKFNRLNNMSQILEDLTDLITTRPSLQDLKEGLLQEIYGRVDQLVESINSIINDDKHLENTYEKIETL